MDSDRKRHRSEERDQKCKIQKVEMETDHELSEEYQPQLLNCQLVGDLISIMLAQAAGRQHSERNSAHLWKQNYCNSEWLLSNLASNLKKKHARFPIAKSVILSIGYNDARLRANCKKKCGRYIDQIIDRLRKRGVKELIITNVPPCLEQKTSRDHWDYLEHLNEYIERLSERSNSIHLCDIFSLFCVTKHFYNSREYISKGVINYEVHEQLYVQNTGRTRYDGITFTTQGKKRLKSQVEQVVDARWNNLRTRELALKENIIGVVDLDDDEDDEDDIVIVDDVKPVVKIEVAGSSAGDRNAVVDAVKKEEVGTEVQENGVRIAKQENGARIAKQENGARTDKHEFSCECEKCDSLHSEQLKEFESLLSAKDSSP